MTGSIPLGSIQELWNIMSNLLSNNLLNNNLLSNYELFYEIQLLIALNVNFAFGDHHNSTLISKMIGYAFMK